MATNRRAFLKSAAVLAAGTTGALAGAPATAAAAPTGANAPVENRAQGAGQNALAEPVPDTLDLADRGRLAINGVLGSLDPAADFEAYFLTFFDVHPAYMVHWTAMVSGVMPKYVESLPLLRLMSGSHEQMDLQNGFMEAMLKNMAGDGLVYDRTSPKRPWNVGVYYGRKDWDEDYAHLGGNGRLLAGLTYWHQWTGEPRWKALAKKTAERMLELAIVRGELAYYPNPGLGNDFSYPRKSGWTTTKPPEKPDEGCEGATLACQLQPIRGLSRYYALTGDERFLELSRKLVNLSIDPKFWGGRHDMNPATGAQRGHFWGHFHGNLCALRGMFDYAVLANDERLKLFVRDAYDYARQNGIPRLGVFPQEHGWTEGCNIADMVGLAVALTDAGMGDYWDDVEQYARNGLTEAQATDVAEMTRVSELGKARPMNSPWGSGGDTRFRNNNRGVLPGQEGTERAIERGIGAFAMLYWARNLRPVLEHCCTANGSQALYYAWEAIVRAAGDSAEVQLWLNRRSPWCDVWSWLPYTGKLAVQNKGMRRLTIRKPGWVRRAAVCCRLDGRDVRPVWLSNRMLFDNLTGRERLEVEVPLAVEKAEYGLVNLNEREQLPESYACEFKGNTAIRVVPVGKVDERLQTWYRLFRREAMKAGEPPVKPASDYIHPEKLVRWMAL